MLVSNNNEGEKRKRRRKWEFRPRFIVFSLGFLLIFSGICLSSSTEKISYGGARWSPARKARFSYARSSSSSSPSESMVMSKGENLSSSSSEKVYDEEKRLVHTGPNPLHN